MMDNSTAAEENSFFCRSLLREGHLVVGCGEMVFKGGQALEGVADIVWVFGCVCVEGFKVRVVADDSEMGMYP